jgi:hemerythrin-like domain-containing protein
MQGFIEGSFFKKEELLFAALEKNGFPVDDGPIAAMRTEQESSRESAEHMRNASQGWLDGDNEARGEVGWAASGYTMTIHQHLERLNNRIYPLLEQNISGEDEEVITAGLSQLTAEIGERGETDKYSQLVAGLQEELGSWK